MKCCFSCLLENIWIWRTCSPHSTQSILICIFFLFLPQSLELIQFLRKLLLFITELLTRTLREQVCSLQLEAGMWPMSCSRAAIVTVGGSWWQRASAPVCSPPSQNGPPCLVYITSPVLDKERRMGADLRQRRNKKRGGLENGSSEEKQITWWRKRCDRGRGFKCWRVLCSGLILSSWATSGWRGSGLVPTGGTGLWLQGDVFLPGLSAPSSLRETIDPQGYSAWLGSYSISIHSRIASTIGGKLYRLCRGCETRELCL